MSVVGVRAVASDVLKRARAMFGRPEPGPQPVVEKKPASAFHAVEIAPGPRCCAAAVRLREQRFLSRDAPLLPLKNCDCPGCSCRYRHYDDRRKTGRRARDLGVSLDVYEGGEKRLKMKRGRRKADG